MKYLLIGVLMAVLTAAAGVAQESTEPDDEPPVAEAEDAGTVESDAGEPVAEREVLETDDESYLDIDDEDFTPSEEIPTDQSISFPTDI